MSAELPAPEMPYIPHRGRMVMTFFQQPVNLYAVVCSFGKGFIGRIEKLPMSFLIL